MSKLEVMPLSSNDTRINDFLERFERRVQATPPGMCPVATQHALLQAGALQTCGKCIPCRDGLPQLAQLIEQVLNCSATSETLEKARALALMVRDASDCAIGYEAAKALLESMDVFAAEYENHVTRHRCTRDVEQKLPCEAMCPAHVNVPGYIALTGKGDYAGAVKMLRKDNPFPTMCALVCEHPCELRCRRNLIDAPINIRGIKKFLMDTMPANKVDVPKRLPDTGKRIAVIGGGPSGMTCAYYAALMGHKVTVFEMHKALGGMTRYGIPAYRLPRYRLDEDLEAVLSVGNIEVKLETKVDAEEMKRIAADYDAVYVAIGAHAGKSLRLENVDAEGVMSAVELLGKIGDGEYPDFTGKKVAVIGGGNVAMDCCRTAVRAGAEEVNCIYRRRVADMTALPAEIESAIAEGVEMLTLQSPAGIEVDESGHCTAVITQPQMIGAVRGGRPAPVNANKPQGRVEADIVLLAVGQDIVSAPFEEFGMTADWGRFKASAELQVEGFENIFVGGDCQTGPSTVIRAIGAGKVAARNIDEYLGYHHTLDCGAEAPEPEPNVREAFGRVEVVERPARERKNDFDYVEEPVSLEEAKQECARCLRCDYNGCGVLEGGRIQYV